MIRLVGPAIALFVVLSAESASACFAPSVRLIFNQTVERGIEVRSGRPCTLPFGISSGPISSHEISQRPAHGTVMVRGPSTFVYRSHPGYVGRDEFTYVRRGLDARGNPAAFTVRVLVRVTR